MNTLLEPAVMAIPLTAAVGAMLFFRRKHIHRQMEAIAEAAKAGMFKRPMRFHREILQRPTMEPARPPHGLIP